MALLAFAPAAASDLQEIAAYIASHNPPAAARLVQRIKELALSLAETPELGRSREELGRALRSFPVGRYVLFYRRTPGGIEIARVLHGMRDLDAIFSDA